MLISLILRPTACSLTEKNPSAVRALYNPWPCHTLCAINAVSTAWQTMLFSTISLQDVVTQNASNDTKTRHDLNTSHAELTFCCKSTARQKLESDSHLPPHPLQGPFLKHQRYQSAGVTPTETVSNRKGNTPEEMDTVRTCPHCNRKGRLSQWDGIRNLRSFTADSENSDMQP